MSDSYLSFEDFVQNTSKANVPRDSTNIKLCIATPDFVGFVKNGGIGTSFYHTAKVLVQKGLKEVDILYCNVTEDLSEEELEKTVTSFAQENINVQCLFQFFDKAVTEKLWPRDIFTVTAYLAFEYLKAKDYDIIIFPEWRGVGYYAMLAKKCGVAFASTALCVQTHSSSLWHALNNQQDSYKELDVMLYQLERGSVKHADFVVSPTHYLLDWKKEHGFDFPEHHYVQPYIISYPDIDKEVTKVDSINEFVFFGRLEKRKGIHYFLNALQRLAKEYKQTLQQQNLKVTFLGKFSIVEGKHVLNYIYDYLKAIPFEIRVLPILNHDEAISYLKNHSCVAFICSVADNSPLTVLECLYHKIPFVASAVGGIPELIAEEYHDSVLFDLHPVDIAQKMNNILLAGHCIIPPKINQSNWNIPVWIEALNTMKSIVSSKQNEHSEIQKETLESEVTVCITHYNREEYLRKTFEGLRQQTFKNFEVIVVDDGSNDLSALEYLNEIAEGKELPHCQVLYQENRFVGAARNKALSLAKGNYIIFMDDDNYARPDQIEIFVKAIKHSQFDALTCFAIAFSHDQDPATATDYEHIYIPLGSGVAANMFGNRYGDANGIYKKSSLLALGGFTEDYGLSWEDYELLANLEIHDYKVGILPMPLMWLRSTPQSVSRRGSMLPNYYRAMRPLLKYFPWKTFGDVLLLSMSEVMQSFSKQELTKNQSPEVFIDLRLQNEIVIIRQTVDNLMADSQLGESKDLLLDVIKHSQNASLLLWDWAILKGLFGEARDALFTISNYQKLKECQVAVVTEQLLNWFLTGESASFLSILETQAECWVDFHLNLGRLYAYSGKIFAAVQVLARCLDYIERDYLKMNPDLEQGIQAGHLRSGIIHYIRHGKNEKRLMNYHYCYVNPFVAHQYREVNNYAQRVQEAINHPEKWKIFSQLLLEGLNGNVVYELYDVCRLMVDEANRQYQLDYSDIDEAVKEGAYSSGLDHFMKHGIQEGRHFALGNITLNPLSFALRGPVNLMETI